MWHPSYIKVRKKVRVTSRAVSGVNHINPKIVVMYQTDTLFGGKVLSK